VLILALPIGIAITGFHHLLLRDLSNQQMHIDIDCVRLTSTLGSRDKVSETDSYLFGNVDIAYVPPGRLYLLDHVYNCVRVLSAATGKELFQFGRKGNGPGEFNTVNRIRYEEGKGLLVRDPVLKRITIFNENGTFKRTITTRNMIDDAVLVNDSSFVASCFLLNRGFKPLRVISLSTGMELTQFGTIEEPREGLISQIERIHGHLVNDSFAGGSMTRIVLDATHRHVFMVQSNPYKLTRYRINDGEGTTLSVPVPFSTEANFTIEMIKEGQGIRKTYGPSGHALAPIVRDNELIVPIFSKEGDVNYLDVYQPDGKLIHRLALPALPKKSIAIAASFNGIREMFLLVSDFRDLNWIEKYTIDLHKVQR